MRKDKIEREKATVGVMIRLYCRRVHGSGKGNADRSRTGKGEGSAQGSGESCVQGSAEGNGAGGRELCPECRELLDYALARLGRCPYGEAKPVCRHCPTHCYSPAMREGIRRVMRFSGPRMVLYAPVEVVRHWFSREGK